MKLIYPESSGLVGRNCMSAVKAPAEWGRICDCPFTIVVCTSDPCGSSKPCCSTSCMHTVALSAAVHKSPEPGFCHRFCSLAAGLVFVLPLQLYDCRV